MTIIKTRNINIINNNNKNNIYNNKKPNIIKHNNSNNNNTTNKTPTKAHICANSSNKDNANNKSSKWHKRTSPISKEICHHLLLTKINLIKIITILNQ